MVTSRPRSARRSRKKPELAIAMVGHAFMGRAHSNAMRQAPRFFDLPFDIVMRVVVGRDQERAQAAADRFGFLEASADLDATLARDDIDVVDVATPNDTHHDVTMAALRAGKHVLCEKPLALTLPQAKAMAREADKSGLHVGLWHNYRRCPATAQASKMIARGDIGEVRQVRAVYLQDWLSDSEAPASWRTTRARCGSGAHGDLNAHIIDLTRAITGLEFMEVCALQQTFTATRPTGEGRKRATVDVDDALAFLAKFDNGAIGTFEATRVAPGRKNMNQVEINGTKGTIVWNLERMNELEFFTFADKGDVRGFRTILCMDEPHPYAAQWWPDGHIIGYEHTFTHHFVDWVMALKKKRAFSPDFHDGVAVQKVLEAALQSATKRRWVTIPK